MLRFSCNYCQPWYKSSSLGYINYSDDEYNLGVGLKGLSWYSRDNILNHGRWWSKGVFAFFLHQVLYHSNKLSKSMSNFESWTLIEVVDRTLLFNSNLWQNYKWIGIITVSQWVFGQKKLIVCDNTINMNLLW